MLDSLAPWLDALRGQYGTIGLFTAAQHAFIAFGLLGGAGSWLIGMTSPQLLNPPPVGPQAKRSPLLLHR